MRSLIQRVSSASVLVQGRVVGEIGCGLLVFAAATVEDGEAEAALLARKISALRIFADEEGRMNRSLLDCGGQLLLVSQFTLFADCRKGRRPSFIAAAPGEVAEPLLERMALLFGELGIEVATGVFGAMMEVRLVNDGPVTIWLDTDDLRRRGEPKTR